MQDKGKPDFYNRKVFEFESYVSIERWISYYHQFKEALELAHDHGGGSTEPIRALIVGKGDGIVPALLSYGGIDATTFDFSDSISPDIVGDVKQIEEYFSENSFDIILCCQVLEHLEYKYFTDILRQFANISPNVVLSLPSRNKILFSGMIKMPIVKSIKPKITVYRFWQRTFKSKWHYWEIGTKGCSAKKVRNDIRKHFTITKDFSDSLNPYHRFMVLSRHND